MNRWIWICFVAALCGFTANAATWFVDGPWAAGITGLSGDLWVLVAWAWHWRAQQTKRELERERQRRQAVWS